MRGNRSELAPGRKSPRCHVNTPSLGLTSILRIETNIFIPIKVSLSVGLEKIPFKKYRHSVVNIVSLPIFISTWSFVVNYDKNITKVIRALELRLRKIVKFKSTAISFKLFIADA